MFPEDSPDGFGELYDLETDPWEMENLYFRPEYQTVLEELKGDLTDWLVTTTRPTTVLGLRAEDGWQKRTRYHNSANADGKVHPDRVKAIRGGNYL
jgi:hypothetical protein